MKIPIIAHLLCAGWGVQYIPPIDEALGVQINMTTITVRLMQPPRIKMEALPINFMRNPNPIEARASQTPYKIRTLPTI